jgi:hypothetical protein
MSRSPNPGIHPLRSDEVEAIEIHDLVPRRDEIIHERLLGVVTGVDLRQSPELGVRTEDEIDGGPGASERSRQTGIPFGTPSSTMPVSRPACSLSMTERISYFSECRTSPFAVLPSIAPKFAWQ